jgi:hypothetical protein
MSEAGFWRSFGAVWLTLPVFVVVLALERHRLGLGGTPLFELSRLTLAVALSHLACFFALPLAMMALSGRLGLGRGCVPFVIVTNWLTVSTFAVMAVPVILYLIGWATPGHARVFALAAAVIALRLHWFAAKATLGVSGPFAAAVVFVGFALGLGIALSADGLLTALWLSPYAG